MGQDIVIHRCKWFGKDLPIATALKNEEATILSAMPRPMSAIMSTKRIALLEKILKDASYPDMGLVNDLKRGFDLVGELPTAGGIMAVEELGSMLAGPAMQ